MGHEEKKKRKGSVMMGEERHLSDDSMLICNKCHTIMNYKYSGIFSCPNCGREQLDDFGKVKKYLQTYGPANALVISSMTGVSRSKINEMLREERLEFWGEKNRNF